MRTTPPGASSIRGKAKLASPSGFVAARSAFIQPRGAVKSKNRLEVDRLLLLLLEDVVDRAQQSGLRRSRHGLAVRGRFDEPRRHGATRTRLLRCLGFALGLGGA